MCSECHAGHSWAPTLKINTAQAACCPGGTEGIGHSGGLLPFSYADTHNSHERVSISTGKMLLAKKKERFKYAWQCFPVKLLKHLIAHKIKQNNKIAASKNGPEKQVEQESLKHEQTNSHKPIGWSAVFEQRVLPSNGKAQDKNPGLWLAHSKEAGLTW